MISRFSLSKALLDKAQEVADNNGYLLVPNGAEYETDPNELYIQEYVIYGPDNTIGAANDSNAIQLGVYQININTPKAWEGSKWKGLEVVDVFVAAFSRGTQLTINSQMLKILNIDSQLMDGDDTHDMHILSINYSVIN